MAFGLTRAPGTFQGALNATLAPGLRKFVLIFFDDILMYSQSLEEHIDHLRQVFQWLRADKWKLKMSKCKFSRESIPYLGHIVSSAGVSIDTSKVQAIVDWPTPSSVKDLQGFLELAGYYCKFIHHFGILAKPLIDLLKKDQTFVWTQSHAIAFQLLKEALCATLVLVLLYFS